MKKREIMEILEHHLKNSLELANKVARLERRVSDLESRTLMAQGLRIEPYKPPPLDLVCKCGTSASGFSCPIHTTFTSWKEKP